VHPCTGEGDVPLLTALMMHSTYDAGHIESLRTCMLCPALDGMIIKAAVWLLAATTTCIAYMQHVVWGDIGTQTLVRQTVTPSHPSCAACPAGLSGDFESEVLRLAYSSLTTPPSIYDQHLPTGRHALAATHHTTHNEQLYCLLQQQHVAVHTA
jgi:hypothetical protein